MVSNGSLNVGGQGGIHLAMKHRIIKASVGRPHFSLSVCLCFTFLSDFCVSFVGFVKVGIVGY